MKPLTLASIVAVAAALPPAIASATPPPPARVATDCNARVYVIDDLVCSTPELLALDRQVADTAARTPDAANPEHPRMIEGQQGWYYRSRQCWKQHGPRRQAACLTAAYRMRLTELEILANPAAITESRLVSCTSGSWQGAEEMMLGRTAADTHSLDRPAGAVRGGELQAIGHPGAQDGWAPYTTYKPGRGKVRFEHHNGAAFIECTDMTIGNGPPH